MNIGKLLLKTEIKRFLSGNIGSVFLLVSGFGVIITVILIPIFYLQFVLSQNIFHILLGYAILILCGIFVILIALIQGFRRKFFEVYENGFVPYEIPISKIFENDFVYFSDIKRIEKEKVGVINIFLIYTKHGRYIEISDYSQSIRATLDADSFNKFIEIIKNYFETHRGQIEWSDKVTPVFQRKKLCKKLSEDNIIKEQ